MRKPSGRTFALKPMKDNPLSRRRFVQGCSLVVAGAALSHRAAAGAEDSSPEMAAFFRPGDAPISDAWRRRLQLPDAKPLVDLLLKTAVERLEDPLPDPEFTKVLATPIGEIKLTDSSVQRYVTATLPKCAVFYYLP